jgi:hypothetical protein
MSKCKVPATFCIFTMLKIGQKILVNIPRIKCHRAVLVPCANNRQTDILNDYNSRFRCFANASQNKWSYICVLSYALMAGMPRRLLLLKTPDFQDAKNKMA